MHFFLDGGVNAGWMITEALFTNNSWKKPAGALRVPTCRTPVVTYPNARWPGPAEASTTLPLTCRHQPSSLLWRIELRASRSINLHGFVCPWTGPGFGRALCDFSRFLHARGFIYRRRRFKRRHPKFGTILFNWQDPCKESAAMPARRNALQCISRACNRPCQGDPNAPILNDSVCRDSGSPIVQFSDFHDLKSLPFIFIRIKCTFLFVCCFQPHFDALRLRQTAVHVMRIAQSCT